MKMSTATQTTAVPATRSSALSKGAALMALAGVAFGGYAVVFFVRNFTDDFLELGIGPNEVAVGREQIARFSPELLHYISHLHIAVSGFIAAAGVAVVALAWFGVRRGQWWAFVTAVAVPVLGLAVALPAHYPNDFDTLGHLGPIYLATAVFVAGALVALRALLESRR
jgi:cytochrome bd-type quinol oxidase subunit 2